MALLSHSSDEKEFNPAAGNCLSARSGVALEDFGNSSMPESADSNYKRVYNNPSQDAHTNL